MNRTQLTVCISTFFAVVYLLTLDLILETTGFHLKMNYSIGVIIIGIGFFALIRILVYLLYDRPQLNHNHRYKVQKNGNESK